MSYMETSSVAEEALQFAGASHELYRSFLSPSLIRLAQIPKVRRLAMMAALKLEKGQFYSYTARSIMSRYYGVHIQAYSYGDCFRPGAFPGGVRIGRYVSIAFGISILVRNHPLDRISTHPFFFNHKLKIVPKDNVSFTELAIDHDAWIGEKVIITPRCNRVGIGAVVGAGSVVTKDVPDFAVVAGNPARLIRYRFSENVIRQLLQSQWWLLSVEDCVQSLDCFTAPLTTNESLRLQSFLGRKLKIVC